MSAPAPQPAEPAVPSPVDPVAPLDRTGGYLGAPGAAAVAAAGRATPARWRLLLRRPTFLIGAGILLFWVICAVFGHLIATEIEKSAAARTLRLMHGKPVKVDREGRIEHQCRHWAMPASEQRLDLNRRHGIGIGRRGIMDDQAKDRAP